MIFSASTPSAMRSSRTPPEMAMMERQPVAASKSQRLRVARLLLLERELRLRFPAHDGLGLLAGFPRLEQRPRLRPRPPPSGPPGPLSRLCGEEEPWEPSWGRLTGNKIVIDGE